MAPPITRQKAIPRRAGTRTPARGDEEFPSRRSRARPEPEAQAARRGEDFPHGRNPVRPEDRT